MRRTRSGPTLSTRAGPWRAGPPRPPLLGVHPDSDQGLDWTAVASAYICPMEHIDGRRARGDITRKRTARCAADIATITGLDSLSIGQLAAGTGLSKSGILTVFENRGAIQLAAIEEARGVFSELIFAPAWSKKPGTVRLGALIDNWFAHVETRVFPGGCFLVAVSQEFGAQKGVVAEAVKEFKQNWLDVIEAELSVGRSVSKKTSGLVRASRFKLDAFMSAANVQFQLMDDAGVLETARTCCRQELESLPAL